MALVINLATKTGTTASYHKIVQTNIEWLNNTAHAVMYSFVSKATRNAGASPEIITSLEMSGVTAGENLVQRAYTEFKLLPLFAASTDDI